MLAPPPTSMSMQTNREARLRAKEAEVRFRSRTPPPDPSHAPTMRQRQGIWLSPLRDHLLRRGPPREPFLEVACGGRPRSTLLTSELGLRGFAVDISLQSLLNARRRLEILGIGPPPTFLCADAEALPFPDRSLNFLFTYEFLHHLPDPGPFLGEVERVLDAGGTYHFDEEPFAPRVRLHLYKRSRECSSLEERTRHSVVRLLHYYTTDHRCRAAEEGILERMDLRLGDWRRALRRLPNIHYGATALGGLWGLDPVRWGSPASLLFDLLGGNLEGDWTSQGSDGPGPTLDPRDLVVCPSCHGCLRGSTTITCGVCGDRFPVVDGIPLLLSPGLRERLYPSLA